MRTMLTAAALALAALGSQTAAAQTAPDQCQPSQTPIVRDHREPSQQPIVRDHRQQARTPTDNCQAQPIVRDHRQPSQQPIVRDHRLPDQSISPSGATVTQPPIVRDPRAPDTPVFRAARYIVRAISLYANDESGPDVAGSDEIVVVFDDPFTAEDRQTTVFGDFDTGETRPFRAAESCITPGPRCERGVSGQLTFGIVLFEVDDWGDAQCAFAEANQAFLPGGCGSDELGRAMITLDAETLSAVPQDGRAMIQRVRLGGYTLSYGVQRVR